MGRAIDDARRIPELVSRAFYTVVSGRPGPVVLALPEDMLSDEVEVADAEPYKVVQPHASAEQVDAVRAMLERAERPLVLVGGSGWDAEGCEDLRRFAETQRLPVVTTFRRQNLFDNRHPFYAGHAGLGTDKTLVQRIRDADVLLAIGPRLGETSTGGYTLLEVPRTAQRLIHVHPSANELGRVYAPDLPINAGTAGFVRALSALPVLRARVWERWSASAHEDYLRRFSGAPTGRALDMTGVMHHLSEHLPKDAIVTNGAGNYAIWLHRYYQYTPYRTQLAPNSGAMGYGLPAAIAAKLVHPERTVVNVAGDGCFLMTAAELATAARYELAVIVLVVNNNRYGSIRAHQEMHYPERVIGTDLTNPDFVAFARSFGAYAERVETTEEFPAALERARETGHPALLELRVDPDLLTPEADLTALRRIRTIASL
jgi:acetolactate synthase-1/2/3 large subunit